MWAGVPSEPLCLHTQSLATAQHIFQIIQLIKTWCGQNFSSQQQLTFDYHLLYQFVIQLFPEDSIFSLVALAEDGRDQRKSKYPSRVKILNYSQLSLIQTLTNNSSFLRDLAGPTVMIGLCTPQ
eukprot:TRINITY_DN4912_c1_g1_i3.p1 TRINITY_DN4912_c1_g1~~TRINITY_DN4912_c1_g1_i3.p1  ORF type:complete len:124 (-),score=9.78 TRINITY_DN4912_c1_g1_i3:12-383(-)